jgi:ribosomal protein S18 acetylase RimI-like enzyme
MAALPEAGLPELVELSRLRVEHFQRLLEEEIARWRELLDWDFRPSADLVRRFVRMKALNGWGLVEGGELIGYSYYVCEETKGLIGDLYLLRGRRAVELESLLLQAVLDSLFATPLIERVEAQLMMLPSPFEGLIPRSRWVRTYARNFMVADLEACGQLPPGPAAAEIRFERYTERFQDPAAELIADAYRGHIDSEINDQYRSVSGARRFLSNIVHYPGCGSFFRPASLVAIDPERGNLVGLSLASLVAERAGHITQICTAPEVRGRGVGYELLRRSMSLLARAGCRTVSLTVTASNREAVRLYERTGFRTQHAFSAYVWTKL